MPTHRRRSRATSPSLPFLLLTALLAVLWMAGGASRADVAGQVVSRGAAVLALILAILFADRNALGQDDGDAIRTVPWLTTAALVLVAAQLVQLPPAVWQSLPGRTLFAQAVDGAQPWRPLSIMPAATLNAAASILVPIAILVLGVAIRHDEEETVLTVLLGMIAAAALFGLIQLSGTPLGNPLVNDTPGAISGPFANRNHFALFLALGCLVAPVWASTALERQPGRRVGWRIPLALGLLLLFFLIILGSGSRAGILTGTMGTLIGLAIARRDLTRLAHRLPRWARVTVPLALVVGFTALVFLAVTLNRAQSVNRALLIGSGEDMRSRALPTVLDIIGRYLPWGTGFGTFDAMFRLHEPFGLLKPTYFNHAHNDFLEIALTGGVPALLLLTTALGWWLVASVRVWRSADRQPAGTGRLGSAMLLLILVASLFDYPARTPLIMAVAMLAAIWLNRDDRRRGKASLPVEPRNL